MKIALFKHSRATLPVAALFARHSEAEPTPNSPRATLQSALLTRNCALVLSAKLKHVGGSDVMHDGGRTRFKQPTILEPVVVIDTRSVLKQVNTSPTAYVPSDAVQRGMATKRPRPFVDERSAQGLSNDEHT